MRPPQWYRKRGDGIENIEYFHLSVLAGCVMPDACTLRRRGDLPLLTGFRLSSITWFARPGQRFGMILLVVWYPTYSASRAHHELNARSMLVINHVHR